MASKLSPKLPLKVRFLIAAHLLGADTARRPDTSVNRSLVSLVDPKASPSNNKPIHGVKSWDTTINSATNLWFRIFVPTTTTAGATKLPVIFFFHGGGFSLMGANSKNYHELCHRLAKNIPAIVISVSYRLSPEHKYPSQYEDGFEALKFVDNASVKSGFNAFDLPSNADLSRSFVAGDSAGGNLAHHVALKASEYNDFHNLQVVGLIAMQPFFGGEERTESEVKLSGAPVLCQARCDWMWKAFLPEGEDRDHPAVNVFGPKSVDISGVKKFPATLLFIGGFDMLQDWQRRYYEGLKKAGKEVRLVEYPNAIHGFYAFPELPESSLLMNEVKDFVEKQQ